MRFAVREELIKSVLARHDGDVDAAAEELGACKRLVERVAGEFGLGEQVAKVMLDEADNGSGSVRADVGAGGIWVMLWLAPDRLTDEGLVQHELMHVRDELDPALDADPGRDQMAGTCSLLRTPNAYSFSRDFRLSRFVCMLENANIDHRLGHESRDELWERFRAYVGEGPVARETFDQLTVDHPLPQPELFGLAQRLWNEEGRDYAVGAYHAQMEAAKAALREAGLDGPVTEPLLRPEGF